MVKDLFFFSFYCFFIPFECSNARRRKSPTVNYKTIENENLFCVVSDVRANVRGGDFLLSVVISLIFLGNFSFSLIVAFRIVLTFDFSPSKIRFSLNR